MKQASLNRFTSTKLPSHKGCPTRNLYWLIQGDCLKVLPKLETRSVDLVITDPPYGFQRFERDDDSCVRITRWAFVEIKRILKRGRPAFVFCPTNHRLVDFINAIPLKFQRILWMYKPMDRTYPWGRWLQTSEAILVFSNQELDHKWINKESYAHDTYIRKTLYENGAANHPTAKPLEVVKDLVLTCHKGDVVLDPFIGSGTTMEACQDLGRSCIGIEINPEYCEIVKKRCFGRKFLDREVEYKFEIFKEK